MKIKLFCGTLKTLNDAIEIAELFWEGGGGGGGRNEKKSFNVKSD